MTGLLMANQTLVLISTIHRRLAQLRLTISTIHRRLAHNTIIGVVREGYLSSCTVAADERWKNRAGRDVMKIRCDPQINEDTISLICVATNPLHFNEIHIVG